MANLQGFRSMLTDYVSAGAKLPCIVLSQDNEFGQTFARVVTVDNRREGESDAEVVGRYIDEICAALADETNASALQVFNELCTTFSSRVIEAWNSVGAIRDQAKSIACEMDRVASALCTADDYLQSHANYGTLRTDFPAFTWGGLNGMGAIQDVAKAVNQLAAPTADVIDSVDKKLFDIVLANITKFVVIKPVGELSSDDRDALLDAVMNESGLTPEGAGAIVDALLGLRGFAEIFNIVKNLNVSITKNMFNDILSIDRFLADAFPVCDGIIGGRISVPDSVKDVVTANAASIATFCKIAAYYEHMMRTTIYRDAFLLQNGLRNSDNEQAFRDAGGTDDMLSAFVRKMHQDNVAEIPAVGVSAKAIIDIYGNISQSIQEDIAAVNRQCALLKSKARVSAFIRVARDYLAKLDVGAYKDISTMVDSKMHDFGLAIAETIRQYNISFVDACVTLIVKTQYPNTFVELLHNKLGVAYLGMMNDGTEKIRDEDIECAEVGVITDLVCDYVVDKFLSFAVCKERLVPGDASSPSIPIVNTPKPEEQRPAQTPEQQVKDDPSATPATEG